MRYFIIPIVFLILSNFAYSTVVDNNSFASVKQERRYLTLIDEIRCPVCQGQSIGGSNAELAKDLREKVREMIINDNRDDEIRQFMLQRYGDFIVFKPPVKISTYFLWYAPFILLLLVFAWLVRYLRSKEVVSNRDDVDTTRADKLLK